MIEKALQKLAGRKITNATQDGKNKSFCLMPLVHLYMYQLGKVTPCCASSCGEEHFMGDMNKSNVLDIWNGEKMKDEIETLYLTHIDWLKKTIQFMKSEDWTNLLLTFAEKTKQLDSLRKENTSSIILELAEILD